MGCKNYIYEAPPSAELPMLEQALLDRFAGDRFQGVFGCHRNCSGEVDRSVAFLIDLHNVDYLLEKFEPCAGGQRRLRDKSRRYCLRAVYEQEMDPDCSVDDVQTVLENYLDDNYPGWEQEQGNERYVCCDEPDSMSIKRLEDFVYFFSLRSDQM